jgi:hypothetical protein
LDKLENRQQREHGQEEIISRKHPFPSKEDRKPFFYDKDHPTKRYSKVKVKESTSFFTNIKEKGKSFSRKNRTIFFLYD